MRRKGKLVCFVLTALKLGLTVSEGDGMTGLCSWRKYLVELGIDASLVVGSATLRTLQRKVGCNLSLVDLILVGLPISVP